MSFSAQGTALASEETLGSIVERTPCISVIIPRKSFSMICACTQECFCAYVWVFMCIFYMHVQASEQHQMMSFTIYLVFWNWVSHWILGLTIKVEWLRCKTKGCAFLWKHWKYKHTSLHLTFYLGTRCQMQVFILWQWDWCCLVQLLLHDF